MKVKFAPDLFLEVIELNRFQKSLDQEGWRKVLLENSESFGLIKNQKTDPNFANAKVIRDTDLGADKTIKINELFGIDSSGELLYSELQTQIIVPNDSRWYWVKVSHSFSTKEKGLFSIATNGDLTGSGSELLTILRGQPNFPSRVKFLNSVYNTQEYDVLEVISDTSCILSGGPFTAETGLKLAVVGTFTPGITVPGGSKFPFQYDSVTTTLVAESSVNSRPTYTDGIEFFLARIKRVGADVVVQDKRLSIYKSKSQNFLEKVTVSDSQFIGVEAVRFNHPFTPRDTGLVDISWTYRSSNFTITSSSNLISLSSGEGGLYKSNTQFVDGDFDGYRIYTVNGKYSKILSSIKSGSNINLTLDVLDIDDFSVDGGTTWLVQELLVTPDCEDVELRFVPKPGYEGALTVYKSFPVNTRLARTELIVYWRDTPSYTFSYRFRTFNSYTEFKIPKNSSSPSADYGYLGEANFDSNGVVTGNYRVESLGGQFDLNYAAAKSYRYQQSGSEGWQSFYPDFTGSNEITRLTPFVNFKCQKIGTDTGYPSFTMVRNYYINLEVPADPGALEFFIGFEADITFGAYSLNFQQGYVNSGSRGTTIYTMDKFWEGKVVDQSILLYFKFDGITWRVMPVTSYNQYDTNLKGKDVRVNTPTLTTAP